MKQCENNLLVSLYCYELKKIIILYNYVITIVTIIKATKERNKIIKILKTKIFMLLLVTILICM